MTRLHITGYRSFELGIFQDKDPKITIIKNTLKSRLIAYLEEGLEWVILGGNLGTDLWASEVVKELQVDYPELQYAVIFPFTEYGSNWNEANQLALSNLKLGAAYVDSTSHQPYENPQQLKNHTQFMLTHTEGALLLYDREFEGKPMFFLRDAERFQEQQAYNLELITMDDLQNYENYENYEDY